MQNEKSGVLAAKKSGRSAPKSATLITFKALNTAERGYKLLLLECLAFQIKIS